MIRTYCDCCGNEITDANSTARSGNELGRLTTQVMPKIGGAGEVLAVQVVTAHEGTWNKGHFCKYCVIDAINKLDDRPREDTVPRHKLQEAETRHVNLLMDLDRLVKGEQPICAFAEVERLLELLAAPGVAAVDERQRFEAKFPKPDAVTWNGSDYEVREGWENSYRIDRFIGQWEAWQACAAGVTAAPAGWKLVPAELTQAMREAWDTAPNGEDDDENMRAGYRAMLAAAPSAPGVEGRKP